jgi:hypothetical protein
MSFSCPVHRIAQVQRRINRKRAVIMSLYGAALLGLPGVIQNPARAAVATLPTAGTAAAASATVAVAAVGGGATIVVQTNGWKAFFGAALATGGLALGVVDPPGGTFFDGSFTYNYPSSLFEVSELGWMGSFGANPGLPALPVDPNAWGSGTSVTLQSSANSALTATVNVSVPGQVTVSFSDPSGFSVPASNPFNFFGVLFEAIQPLQVVALGMGPDPPPPGANLFVSTSGFSCTPAGSTLIETCGESETQYFELRAIPEPSTWVLASLGFATFGGVRMWRRQMRLHRFATR